MQEIHKKNWSMTCAIRDKEPLSFVDSDARDFAISSKGNFLDISSLIDIQSLRLSSQIDIQSTAPRWPLSTAFPIREVPWSLRASAAPTLTKRLPRGRRRIPRHLRLAFNGPGVAADCRACTAPAGTPGPAAHCVTASAPGHGPGRRNQRLFA